MSKNGQSLPKKWRIASVCQGFSNYSISENIVLMEKQTDQGKNVFHGPTFNTES